MLRRKQQNQQRKQVKTLPIYVALVVLFVLYIIFEKTAVFAVIIGALLFVTLIILLIVEIYNGVKQEGMVRNIIEIVVAIGAVILFWYALRFFTNTQYPLDVVPSCSMLPVLQRGDMILLDGIGVQSNGTVNVAAPVINVSRSQFEASFSNPSQEALQCIAYTKVGNGYGKITQFYSPNETIGFYQTVGTQGTIVSNVTQSQNLVKYTCGLVNVKMQNGTIVQEVATTAITINNYSITGDKNNSIIVYQTSPQDLFYKDGDSYIVHRVYALLDVNGSYYSLTKGDNNAGLDIQYYNSPANLSQIQGKVIGSIPYIGYLKLILSNNFVEPTGCNYTIEN